jgi:hypothetical protein
MSKLQQENKRNSVKMTTRVPGALYHTEKRNVLDWLRDKMTARTAGLLYFVNGAAGLFSYKIVPGRLIVQGNATATANHILASEMLFRVSIVSELIGAVAFIFLAMTLYRLFNGVNKTHASLLVAFILVASSIMFLIVLNEIAALALFHGADYLSVFQKQQLDAQGMLFLDVHDQGVIVANIFWGLWLFPFGVLVMRSGFIPRILGILLIAACFGYVANSLMLLLLPSYAPIVNLVTVFSYILGAAGEGSTQLWLLIKGVKMPRLAAPPLDRAVIARDTSAATATFSLTEESRISE